MSDGNEFMCVVGDKKAKLYILDIVKNRYIRVFICKQQEQKSVLDGKRTILQ